MFCTARAKLYSIVCLLLFVSLQSCSDDSTGSSVADQPKNEYLSASQCDVSDTNRPEVCAPNAPYLIGKYKVGHVYLHIPSQYLQQPVGVVRDLSGASHTVCWPSLKKDLTGCAPSTGRIKIYMRPGSPPGSVPDRHMTREELLAEATENLTGPFQIEGTQIDEYRRRNGYNPVFSFQAEDEVRNAKCGGYGREYGRCIVSIWDYKGLSIRYEFGVNFIGDWQKIDAEVRSQVASFVVDEDSN